jgi:hypothetical protein
MYISRIHKGCCIFGVFSISEFLSEDLVVMVGKEPETLSVANYTSIFNTNAVIARGLALNIISTDNRHLVMR